MGYLFLAVSLTASTVKAYCGKRSSGAIRDNSDAAVMNFLRMLICVLIGAVIVVIEGGVSLFLIDRETLLISVLSGAANAIFVVVWMLAVKGGAYMMVEVFILLGIGVPLVLCDVMFGESVSVRQIIGFVILLAAIYIMCTYNTSVKGKMRPVDLILLTLCGLSSGVADFSQKLYVKSGGGSASVFNLYTYLFGAVILLFALLVFRQRERTQKRPARPVGEVLRPIWFYIPIMAICLFAASLFKTLAANYLNAAQLYPLNQGSMVVIGLLMASLLFGEKINLKCIVGIALSFLALMLINL